MAVKTTKIQCNQDVDVRGKVDIEGKVTCGGDAEVDGGGYFDGRDVTIGGRISEGDPISYETHHQGAGLITITKGNTKYGFVGTAYMDPSGDNNRYLAGMLFSFWPMGGWVKAGTFAETDTNIIDQNVIELSGRLNPPKYIYLLVELPNEKV